MSVCDRRTARARLAAHGVAAVLLLTAGAGQASADDRIIAASEGNGAVEVLWVPDDGDWPAGGWLLERVTAEGATIVGAELGPGRDRAALDRLDPDAAAGILDFADKLARGTLSEEERAAADTILVVAAVLNVDRGRALGLRFRDTGVPAGQVSYRLTALSDRGAELRAATSDPLDAATATPLPYPPEALAIDVGDTGIAVSWLDPPNPAAAPIVGYRVVRVEGDAETDLTPELHLRPAAGGPERLSFLDVEPVRDGPSAYDVASVDLFGRSSTPKRVEVGPGDLARATVPAGLTIEAGTGSARLAWAAVGQPGVAGYVVERSLFIGGPWEAVTPDGLPVATTTFDDAPLSPGTAYFFRVRVFDAEGNLGRPSVPAKTIPLAAGPPAAPQNLTAEAGPSRVALAWDEAATPVAGYFVERRLDGDDAWKRLTGTVAPEPFYYDRFERGAFSGETLHYRVQAIGLDSGEGDFSDAVAVAFGDDVRPPAPAIVDVSGDDGVVRLTFAPGVPEEDADRFLLLRSGDEKAASEVVGEPLPATAREAIDGDVTPGEVYWYALVAVDAAENMSDPSDRVLVAVAAPSLPPPPPPTVAYSAEPFPHVQLALPAPPARALTVVEARAEGEDKWFVVAGPFAEAETVNLTGLPENAAAIAYRLVFEAVNGARGAPSDAVTVALR